MIAALFSVEIQTIQPVDLFLLGLAALFLAIGLLVVMTLLGADSDDDDDWAALRGKDRR